MAAVPDAQVSQVRRFNRIVTQRVGALNDHFLARARPLGEARVLWEIGEQGCEVRLLRSRLDLDSGYLSRMLRALEGDGLITVGPSDDDGRVRTARLTRKGRRERAVLNRRSDELAEALLEPLTSAQRDRLVSAMAEVERLLAAALVRFDVVDPADGQAQYCLREYYAELGRRFSGGFDPSVARPTEAHQMRLPAGLFVMATLRGEPVGCGALTFHDDSPTELKRLWVSPAVRGLGVGRRLLAELEAHAVAHGCDVLRLDTNAALSEAIAMYRATGWREIPRFNDEPYAHHWFEKLLGDRPCDTSSQSR